MKIEEIFTNDAWDASAQELFRATLNKKRTQKLYFIYRKASVFLDKPSAEEKQTGIDILDEVINNYLSNKNAILSKEKYPAHYKGEISRMTVLLAEVLIGLNRNQQALELLDLAEKDLFTQEQHEDWNCRTYFFNDAYILRASIAIQDKNADLAKQHILKARELQENAYIDYLNIETKLAYLTQDFSETDKEWSDWYDLETYPFDTLKQLEYISAVSGQVSLDFEDAAETFIVNHDSVLNGKNISSLKSLDDALKDAKYDIERLDKTYLREGYLAELGAFIGEVLIQELNGNWKAANTMTSSNVQIENELISPFQMAFDTVYLKRRLIEDIFEKRENYSVNENNTH